MIIRYSNLVQESCGLNLSEIVELINNCPKINWDNLQESDLQYPIVSYYVLHGYINTVLQPMLYKAYEYYVQLRNQDFPIEFLNSRQWDSNAQTFVGNSLTYNKEIDKEFELRYEKNCLV